MDNFYRDNILDHYKNPRNFGRLENPTAAFEEENVICGDKIGMEVNTGLESGEEVLKEISFFGEGCAISMACASLLTEKVKGQRISQVMEMNKEDIVKLLGIELSLSRLKCALLPLEVLHKIVSPLVKRA